MRQARMRLHQLVQVAVCAAFSVSVRAAEESPPAASGSVARTTRPGCAKLVCQRRTPTADRESSTEPGQLARGESELALRFGLGAASFRGPKPDDIGGGLPVEIIREYNG